MKFKIKLSIALVMSLMLVACDSGGSAPPKKVFKLVKEEIILGGSASVPNIIINTYDDKGVLVRRDRDGDGDGTLEIYYTYTYNEKGELLIRETHILDGSVIIIEEYDEHQNRVSILNDTNRDGVLNYSAAFVNTYDDTGKLLKIESPLGTSTYVYDEGTIIISFDKAPEDGNIDGISAKTYNEHGDIIKNQRDGDFDGELDEYMDIHTYIYTFDKYGNIIKKERDLTNTNPNNNTHRSRVTVYTWEEFK